MSSLKLKREKYLVMSGVMEYMVTFKIPIHNFDEVDPGYNFSNDSRPQQNSGQRTQNDSDRKHSNLFSRNSPERDILNEDLDSINKRLKTDAANGNPDSETLKFADPSFGAKNITDQGSMAQKQPAKQKISALNFAKIKSQQNKEEIFSTLEQLKLEGIEANEMESSEDDVCMIDFEMPSDPKKGELRLKLLVEEENITISLDRSKEHKKMMKFTAG